MLQNNLKAFLFHKRPEQKRKGELPHVFGSNYVSRCAQGGQGLKMKVPGCGVPRRLQCVHSTLEGGDEQSAACFFSPPRPSERPHFAVVYYETATFPLAIL